MIDRIKFSSFLTLKVLMLSFIAFMGFAIFIEVFGDGAKAIFVLNPFVSGFIHGGLDHILFNLGMIFLFSLSPINSEYDIKRIFWVTFILSCLYLPVSLLHITEPAIGISGTCFFLMTRFFFSRNSYKILWYSLYFFLLLSELYTIAENDGTAHGVHILGALLGYISLKKDSVWIPKFISRFI